MNLLREADGVIIASAAHTHVQLAEYYIKNFVPVLIEKPVAMNADDAHMLLAVAEKQEAIAFAGHTRLYSNAWRRFRDERRAEGIYSVYATAGGICNIDPLWDWGPHLVSMCVDIGYDPREAHIVVGKDEQPLEFFVNGQHRFTDVAETPTPLEVLLGEFTAAIEAGDPSYDGLRLSVEVTEVLEESEKATDERTREAAMLAHRDRQPAGTVWH